MSSIDIDLAFTPALELAKLILDRQITPLDLTQLFLERIEKYNSKLGSFFFVAKKAALKDAEKKTKKLNTISNLNYLPPFFGVPIGIKDLNSVVNMPLTYGISALKNNVASYDDEVTKRLKNAGFIILGKTATSQLGSFPYTEPPGFLPSRNPWNLDYTSGGSSGGSAAAVASGMCPIAQGSDGGGSIRGPAGCCGLVGIKPSRGRVSNAPMGDYQSGISSNGPIARTVSDAAALLDIMAGYTKGDPYWLPTSKTSFLEASKQVSQPLTIAFSHYIPPFLETELIIKKTIQKTASLLESLGHHLEEKCPSVEALIDPFTVIWQSGVEAAGLPLSILSPLNIWLQQRTVTAGEYLQAVHKVQIFSRKLVSFFDTFDILVLPVYLHQPIKVGEWSDLSPEKTLDKIINWISPCPAFNASGLPVISLPMGYDDLGLPIGIQLVGKPADELALIRVAAQLEKINNYQMLIPNSVSN